MSVLQQVNDRLAALESRLADRPEDAEEVRAIRRLLTGDGTLWIGTVEARRLLGVKSINTVKAWARLGLLRSRQAPNGRLKIHLDDVLREAHARQALEAMGGIDEPLSGEEWDALRRRTSPEAEAIVGEIVRLAEARLARG